MNKNLKKQIDLAKQKAMNFAIVGTASKPVKLLLSNKKIPDSAVKDAKDEFGGNAVLRGVVKGDGSNLTFESVDASSFDEGKLKKLIKEETEVTVSVAFKQVTEIKEVDEKDSDSPKNAPSEEVKEVNKRFVEMSKKIGEAAEKYPNEKVEIARLAKKVQREIAEEDHETANVTLIELEHYIKALDRQAAPKGPEPTNAIEAAERRRKDYCDRMAPRYEVLASTETDYNLDNYLGELKELLEKWKSINRDPITKQEVADSYDKKQQEMDLMYQRLVLMPQRAKQAKKELMADLSERLEQLSTDFKSVKNAMYQEKKIVDSPIEKPLQDLLQKDMSTWTSPSNFQKSEEVIKVLEAKMEGYMKTFEKMRRESLEKGDIKLTFDGDDTLKEADLANKIKGVLPASCHKFISQSMNDVLLGRGKATTGHANVLHASAGKSDGSGSCTLFFTRDSKGNVEVLGVGQHKTNTSYTIYHGTGTFGNVLSL